MNLTFLVGAYVLLDKRDVRRRFPHSVAFGSMRAQLIIAIAALLVNLAVFTVPLALFSTGNAGAT